MTTLFVATGEHEAVIASDSSMLSPDEPDVVLENPYPKIHALTPTLLMQANGHLLTSFELRDHLLEQGVGTVRAAAEASAAYLEPLSRQRRLHVHLLGREEGRFVLGVARGLREVQGEGYRIRFTEADHVPYEVAVDRVTPGEFRVIMKPGYPAVGRMLETEIARSQEIACRRLAALAVVGVAAHTPYSNDLVEMWTLPHRGVAARVPRDEVEHLRGEAHAHA